MLKWTCYTIQYPLLFYGGNYISMLGVSSVRKCCTFLCWLLAVSVHYFLKVIIREASKRIQEHQSWKYRIYSGEGPSDVTPIDRLDSPNAKVVFQFNQKLVFVSWFSLLLLGGSFGHLSFVLLGFIPKDVY
jgi:hypothetical protein